MKWFIVGVIPVWLIAAAFCLVDGRPEMMQAIGAQEGGSSRDVELWAGIVFVLPCVCAAMVAQGMQLVSPRRVLDARAGLRVGGLVRGVVVSVMGLVFAAAGVYFSEVWWVDLCAIGGASALAAVLVLVVAARSKAGECAKCRYDLAGVTLATGGKCPECGVELMVMAR